VNFPRFQRCEVTYHVIKINLAQYVRFSAQQSQIRHSTVARYTYWHATCSWSVSSLRKTVRCYSLLPWGRGTYEVQFLHSEMCFAILYQQIFCTRNVLGWYLWVRRQLMHSIVQWTAQVRCRDIPPDRHCKHSHEFCRGWLNICSIHGVQVQLSKSLRHEVIRCYALCQWLIKLIDYWQKTFCAKSSRRCQLDLNSLSVN